MRKALSIAVVVVSAFAFISFSGTSAFATDSQSGTNDDTSTAACPQGYTESEGENNAVNCNCSFTGVNVTNGELSVPQNYTLPSGIDLNNFNFDDLYKLACQPTEETTTPVTPGQGEGTPTPAAPATPVAATPAPVVLPYTAGPSPLAGIIAAVTAAIAAGSALLVFGIRTLRR